MQSGTRKTFDFNKYKQRHIALKILYFGWDYNGLAEQAGENNTIEYHLFHALTKTCLVQSRGSCKFNRCGRTDKGVSSSGQVVNLNVRSQLIDEEANLGLFTPDGYVGRPVDANAELKEIDYINILNKNLPDHIKTIAWSPVPVSFSSRFDCKSRSYSYIFPKGDLDIEAMQAAASLLVGEHDFRNLCSFDLKNNVISHTRTILSAKITALNATSNDTNQYSFYELVIVGKAFLYHQIRCIMTILFLVGVKQENPQIISDMLDINKCPARPNYNRASPLPLNLFDCSYHIQFDWNYEPSALTNLLKQLKQLWTVYKTKTMMIEQVLTSLESRSHQDSFRWRDFGLACDTMSENKYVPILKRPRDETLETKLKSHEVKKRKKSLMN